MLSKLISSFIAAKLIPSRSAPVTSNRLKLSIGSTCKQKRRATCPSFCRVILLCSFHRGFHHTVHRYGNRIWVLPRSGKAGNRSRVYCSGSLLRDSQWLPALVSDIFFSSTSLVGLSMRKAAKCILVIISKISIRTDVVAYPILYLIFSLSLRSSTGKIILI